jgi:F-type H+-transporting ATPase subunit b
MVCFWVTFWVVKKFLIDPIWAVLADRKQRIDSAQSAWAAKNDEYLAATARVQNEIEEAAREAARVRAEHRQDALNQRQQTLERARAEADGKLQSALSELASEADAARVDLRRRAEELGRLLAGRLVEREIGT